MVKANQLSLPVTFFVENEVTDGDTRFLNVVIDILHTGKNYNDTIFTKEVVDACVDSIKNTAILGYIREYNGEKDFKGHEYILTKTDENGVVKKYIGSAYGVIPESCNPRWVEKMCDDGKNREFLQVDGLLWTKFMDSTEIFLRDIVKNQSMEIDPESIEGYEDDDGNFVFTSFKFNGSCCLGDALGIEPAMINSTITVQFSISDFVKNIQDELSEKIGAYTRLVAKSGNNKNEGGNGDMAMSILQQYEYVANIVEQYETFSNRWGDTIARYGLVDIQDNEVIVVDRKDNYNYYGFTFTQNGDDVNIDFTNGVRKKISYTNFETGSEEPVNENIFDFGKEIIEIENKAFTKVEEANTKVTDVETNYATMEQNYNSVKADYDTVKADYDTMKADYEVIKPEYEKLVEAEQARQEAEVDAQKDAEFAKFEKALGTNEEFTALKEKKSELSVDDIATQCAILFTKVNLEKNTNFSRGGNQKSVGIMDDGFDEGNTNYISSERYGNIPVNR